MPRLLSVPCPSGKSLSSFFYYTEIPHIYIYSTLLFGNFCSLNIVDLAFMVSAGILIATRYGLGFQNTIRFATIPKNDTVMTQSPTTSMPLDDYKLNVM